jgi:hypothetical protein
MQSSSKARRNLSTALLLLGLLVLANCSYLRGRDTSADNIVIPHSDATTDTKREACVRACSHDHDICNDGPESRNDTFDAPQQFVGAAAGCDQSLRECLKTCK